MQKKRWLHVFCIIKTNTIFPTTEVIVGVHIVINFNVVQVACVVVVELFGEYSIELEIEGMV